MASVKPVFLFLFFIFPYFPSTTQAVDPIILRQNCTTNDTFTAVSAFQLNLITLLMSLSSNATGTTQFFNTTIADINPSDTVYGLFMCRGDVPSDLCRECVVNGTQRLGGQNSDTCPFSKGAIIWYEECMIRYSNLNFFSTVDTMPRMRLRNTVNVTDADKENFMKLLYTTLNETVDEAAKAPVGMKKYATKEANMSAFQTLYTLTQCTPDLTPQDCGRCLAKVIADVPWCCTYRVGGRVLYPSCNFRYEFYPFFRTSTADVPSGQVSPAAKQGNSAAAAPSAQVSPAAKHQGNHNSISLVPYLNYSNKEDFIANNAYQFNLNSLYSSLSSNAAGATQFYNATSHGGNSSNRVYGLLMCRGDASQQVCRECVVNATNRLASKRKIKSSTITMVVVLTIIVLAIVLCSGYCFLRRKARQGHEDILKENFRNEITTWESLQFDFATIEDATNNFSQENRIGKGGFGEVYKGVLKSSRQEIAVKRLSKSSEQGAVEFKNEVLLIANLQHRNLVTLLGFCLEEQEKILVYEYVPNKSLDNFLFDHQKQRILTWFERYKIIGGIARGILYLHEHSRLKVIHRDLKPSNILLDHDMNPKISDFGLAKMVAIDHAQGNTNRVVGTFGYMSPEYAMHGKFSTKSDIFSFGVMVLEIVSGKRNTCSFESHRVDDLLSNAWKQWNDQTPLQILDPKLEESYAPDEVKNCIQIGLLCVQENPDDRPSMSTVVLYFSTRSVELPSPREPVFSMHGRLEPSKAAHDSRSAQSTNNSMASSVNKMSISQSIPR